MLRLTNPPPDVAAALDRIGAEGILERIWSHDHTVWKDDPTEIANRLAWLNLPETTPRKLERVRRFAGDVREDGVCDVLLLGMGGSSLAPETLATTFGHADGFPSLRVLDSTHPDAVLETEGRLDPSRTLFVVATKSGATTETLSLFRYFHARVAETVGLDRAGSRFVAITDPGSPLVALARKHAFREVFENDPNLGGRYSALSLFGLVPAALLGIDVGGLLERAREVAVACASSDTHTNPAARLGALLGVGPQAGRDKATFLLSDEIAGLGNWIEQLVAESTGKEGTGILPVVGEPVGPPSVYGSDRLFVNVCTAGDRSQDAMVERLVVAGHPVARAELDDRLALGGQFFLWEFATAIAGHLLRVNPFDQPNVEAAKARTREMVNEYRRTGAFPETFEKGPTAEALNRFLNEGVDGSYVAIQAYLPPSPGIARALQRVRMAIRDRRRLATTVGFGPRFLHSTGQLHKGDRGNGLFVQFVVRLERDVPIPDDVAPGESALTFGALIAAQASGDRQALIAAGRRVLTVRLDREGGIEQLENLAEGLS